MLSIMLYITTHRYIPMMTIAIEYISVKMISNNVSIVYMYLVNNAICILYR